MDRVTRNQLMNEISRFKHVIDGLKVDGEVTEAEHAEMNKNVNHIRNLLYGTGFKNNYWTSKQKTQVWKPQQ